MPVEHLGRAGLRQAGRWLGRRGGKVIPNLTWDDAVKGLQHQTRETLNSSKYHKGGYLDPSDVKIMEDTFAKNTEEGLEFLEEFEDAVLNDNNRNLQGHLFRNTQEANGDFQKAAIENSRGQKLEPDPDPDDLLPLGPWALKKSGEGVVVPEIDDSLSRSLLAANDQKDLIKGLRTPLYTGIAEQHIQITPEEIVSSGLFDSMVKRQGLLEEQAIVTREYKAQKDALKGQKLPEGDRSFSQAKKNFKTNNRALNDLASANIFTTTKDVFSINRPRLKKLLPIFGEGKKEWHHTQFFNSQGGKAFLNKIAQDPMVTANLFLKLKELDIQTSGTIKNLSLGDQAPHNEFHKMLRKKGFEAWYDPKKKMLRGGEADIGELLEAIAESVGKGETSINEMFDILEVFSRDMVPWLKKQTKEQVGPAFEEIPGFVKATDNYAKETDVITGRVKKPVKSTAPQEVLPSKPPGSPGQGQPNAPNIKRLQELDNQLGDMMEGVKSK